jgi:16S rRNA (adenine1518-N6/adenine1519-N6)-dimethyltransferase
MKAKKSLGQNFLKSEPALRKIVESGEIKSDDVILEIGPGKGALTRKLLEKSGTVIAVEKDRELFELLKIKFEKEILEKKLILLNKDILEFEITNYELRKYKIIANIPYNITGAILKKFLTDKNQPSLMVLMVQHEVAKRIMASDKKESILSISVKAYGEPKMVMKVPARYFTPSPNVDSAVILIKNISRENFTSPQPSPYKGEGGSGTIQNKFLNSQAFEERFWEIVKAGFAHKRKKLLGNLKNIALCQSVSLTGLGNKRAEDLTLKDWLLLAK